MAIADPLPTPYDFELPADRIAARPVYPYDHAKLLVVHRHSGRLEEHRFCDLPSLLPAQTRFVMNNTRVVPARLFGKIPRTGAAVELLLIENEIDNCWICAGRPLKRLRAGERIEVSSSLSGEILERIGPQRVRVAFSVNSSNSESVQQTLWRHGVMPIPPYIRSGRGDEQDRTDYQSLFAAVDGSIAAPTASLHFTPDLVSKLTQQGATWSFVTLHVGAPSFTQVWDEVAGTQALTPPGRERYQVNSEVLSEIAATRKALQPVVTVGTTVVRALESLARASAGGAPSPAWGDTELFIAPGFEFKIVDCLITNFHQPRSTHLLLVEALLGKKLLAETYDFALAHEFRFFSYGDGMLVL